MMDVARGVPSDPVSDRKPVIFQASHGNKTNQRAEGGERTVQRTFIFCVFSVRLLEPSPGLPAPLALSRSGVLPPHPSIGAQPQCPHFTQDHPHPGLSSHATGETEARGCAGAAQELRILDQESC